MTLSVQTTASLPPSSCSSSPQNSVTGAPIVGARFSSHQHQHQDARAKRSTLTNLTNSANTNSHGNHQSASHSSGHVKGHQRRQSVARLLPDISKLRLLSWLVEASSELLSCDIAIMDGVYAKLNKSQESLLFWQTASAAQAPAAPAKHSQYTKRAATSSGQYQDTSDFDSLPASLPLLPPKQSANTEDECAQSDADDDAASSSSSATSRSSASSGIHGSGHTSISTSLSSSSGAGVENSIPSAHAPPQPPRGLFQAAAAAASVGRCSARVGAEHLRMAIRQTMLQHMRLQALLVNIIRQHDRRTLIRRQHQHLQPACGANEARRVDLAAIAESLDDGCACSCHGNRRTRTLPATATAATCASQQPPSSTPTPPPKPAKRASKRAARKQTSQTLAANLTQQQQRAAAMCENCAETHYWLHATDDANAAAKTCRQEPPASVALRNANFVKLVQQQVRAILAKAIELIDLIRKEIKSPESIKQTHLMRCFAASIQLLTSVGCYVMPAHDIQQHMNVSSFILEPRLAASSLGRSLQASSAAMLSSGASSSSPKPAPVGGASATACADAATIAKPAPNSSSAPTAQASASSKAANDSTPRQTIFRLPSTDFDHLPYGQPSAPLGTERDYHLAAAPELPVRSDRWHEPRDSPAAWLASRRSAASRDYDIATDKMSKLNTVDPIATPTATTTASSSGASSTSSSMARASVQQSSVSRVQICDDHDTMIPSSLATHNHDSLLLLVSPAGNSTNELCDSLTRSTSNNKRFHSFDNNSNFASSDDYFNSPSGGSLKFWQSSKFNFIRKLLQVKRQRLLRQQKKDRKLYNHKIQSKLRLVMMDLVHFNKSQQLLATENGVNSLLTSMRNALEFGLYLTLKLY